ncbi:unnamed protein product [Periconia digitata]|uniref:Uncharacterized protein n=1 Tax=Periconia digitata TaxID=1303443 RepID=A0A9W4U2U5_9PLEO|nr:unnamed protein product [Periconia digitata]
MTSITGLHMLVNCRGATTVLGKPGVCDLSSVSSGVGSRPWRFRLLVVCCPRLRVVMCGVDTASSAMTSIEFPRSDFTRSPDWDSESAATVSVCEITDWLLLLSRADVPACEDAILPGLAFLVGAFRRDLP